MPIEYSIDQQAIVKLGAAIRAEEDGNVMRRELTRNLRATVEPAVIEIRAGVMAVPSSGISEGESLRAAVSQAFKVDVRYSGQSAGVRIRARKTPGIRGFTMAPRRLNDPRGWRHRVFGRDVWVQQYGNPRYFDNPIHRRSGDFRRDVLQAIDDMAKRIANRTRSG